MADVLELGSDGWLLGGLPWQPEAPFYAVLGDPIAHSLSPYMQSAALAERELEHQYLPVRISAGQLRRLKTGPEGRMLAGFNVTAPLKEAVSVLCDGRTDQARDLGAVNTVRVDNGKWLGHNTDSGGVLTVLSQAWPAGDPPDEGIVLGAGGSARAAVDALLRWNVGTIEVWNRSAAGRDRMGSWLKGRGLDQRVFVTGLPAEPAPPVLHSRVWLCCLAGCVAIRNYLPESVGKHPEFLLDLRYGDQRPEEVFPAGFSANDGLPVLLMQGGLSFAWWFGPPVPWQAMRDGLDL
jgi:shikimate dehydrogenase